MSQERGILWNVPVIKMSQACKYRDNPLRMLREARCSLHTNLLGRGRVKTVILPKLEPRKTGLCTTARFIYRIVTRTLKRDSRFKTTSKSVSTDEFLAAQHRQCFYRYTPHRAYYSLKFTINDLAEIPTLFRLRSLSSLSHLLVSPQFPLRFRNDSRFVL